MQRPWQVLVLCTGNSARSILGEYLLAQRAPERFATASAGSHPRGTVHPDAIRVLSERYGIDASGASSKSILSLIDRPFDLVLTVCDHAKESCPVFPGAAPNAPTAMIHWGLPDPAAVDDPTERLAAFEAVARTLDARFERLVSAELPDHEALIAQARSLSELFVD